MRFREDWLPVLRDCLDGATDWYGVESCFRSHVADDEIDDARPVVYAFGYMLVMDGSDELRARTGVFAPRIEWNNGAAFPEPLDRIPEDMLHVWEQYADGLSEHPVAASRLGDLLWVRRFSARRAEHARNAVDSYLALSMQWDSMEVVETISRALEISTEINDLDRQAAAVRRAVEAARGELVFDEWRPGIALGLLESLATLKPASRPAELNDLLAQSFERYRIEPFIAQSVSDLQAKLADPSGREQIAIEQVRRWRAEADQATGLVRYAHLQQALGIARSNGLADLANSVLADMQAMSDEDFEWKRLTSEIRIPTAEREAETSRIAEASASLEEALSRFGLDGPPSGKVEANEHRVDELARHHSLTVLMPLQLIGSYGELIFEATNLDEHRRVNIAQQEALQIRLWGLFATEKLHKIIERFGVPSRDDLIALFTTELIDVELAARFADGLSRHFAGDDDGALYVLLAQIEAAIRGITAKAGVPVIKNPHGTEPGGVITLGGLLSSLRGRMDDSWRRYLRNALVDPLGVNLRNEIAHGLHGPTTPSDVVIAVHIACHLRLLRAVTLDGTA